MPPEPNAMHKSKRDGETPQREQERFNGCMLLHVQFQNSLNLLNLYYNVFPILETSAKQHDLYRTINGRSM
jgi:hypothetical protein